MNIHDFRQAWDIAVEDALARARRDEQTNLKQVAGMEIKSGLAAGDGTWLISACETCFKCTEYGCTIFNC